MTAVTRGLQRHDRENWSVSDVDITSTTTTWESSNHVITVFLSQFEQYIKIAKHLITNIDYQYRSNSIIAPTLFLPIHSRWMPHSNPLQTEAVPERADMICGALISRDGSLYDVFGIDVRNLGRLRYSTLHQEYFCSILGKIFFNWIGMLVIKDNFVYCNAWAKHS